MIRFSAHQNGLVCILLVLGLGSTLIRGISDGFSVPNTPTVNAAAEHGRVILYWDDYAESSVDSLTGYADFEGYRIYRSTDGGITWGTPDDRIYDYDANFIGWQPIAQFDLSFEQDSLHCMYPLDVCGSDDPKRNTSISGPDPAQPRINLGEDSGLQYVYIDEDVVDGLEYTYTVTAYDIGLRTYEIEFSLVDTVNGIYQRDTVWSSLNPGHFTSSVGGGYPSLECPRGNSDDDLNFIRIIPGFYASNITFPDNINEFFLRQPGTIGTGEIEYNMVDSKQLENIHLKYEIQAGQAQEAVAGMACESPYIYVYQISDSVSQTPVVIDQTIPIAGLNQDVIDSLLDFPGAFLSENFISIPYYRDITVMNSWSEQVAGIQYRFTNLPDRNPVYVLYESIEWSANTDSMTIRSVFPGLLYSNDAYGLRPNFDYIIEFFDTPVGDTIPNIWNQMTPMPFRITNLTTGKKVGLWHSDTGVLGNPPDFELGSFDLNWTRNEQVKFLDDTLQIANQPDISAPETFWLYLTFDPFTFALSYVQENNPDIFLEVFQQLQQGWSNNQTYREGRFILHKAMLWIAVSTNAGVEPSHAFIDNNGDGINDNPWKIFYPWSGGESVILRPEKFYTNGDNWVADMSSLGKPVAVTNDILDSIQVVPNPYIVRSGFNETPETRRLRFIKLPQQCRISIYTVTGELVDYVEHIDPYEGNAWWDLRNMSGKLVAPGLYIYVVEAEGKEHIGKFAVVR